MRWKKYIAPVVVSVLLIAYLAGAAAVFFAVPDIPFAAKAVAVVVPVILCAVVIAVLIQRVKEVKSGEEDDLDKF